MSISDNKCGFQVGNLAKVPERFKCPKCLQLLHSPVQGECGHRYCSDAITNQGFDCIACKAEGEEDVPHLTKATVRPDPAIARELNWTKFQCPWHPCQETMLLPDLVQHLETACKHREVSCKQCDSQLPASAMEEHLNSQCPKRQVECESCKQLVQNDQLEEHKNRECVGSTEPCRSCLARVRDTDEARLQHAINECPVGWANGQNCPFGCGPVTDAEVHRNENVALHADRFLAKMRGSHVDAQEADDVGAVALEPSSPGARSSQTEMQLVEDVFDKAELVLNLEQYGYPEHPRQTSDPRGQTAFFERVRFARAAPDELDKQRDIMQKKLNVTYRAMDPLMTQMQRQYEELSAGDSMYKELLCAMSLKEVRICDLDRSIMLQEAGSSDGTLVWKIPFFKERTSSTEYEPVIYSPVLYTDKFGYKLSAVAYLNGSGRGRGSHISLYARINKGPYDAALKWPFKQKVTFTLLNQSSPQDHLVRHIVPDSSSQFQRPSQPMGQMFGIEQFSVKEELETKGFLKDDTLFVKIQVVKPPLF